jgi:hypothetical protein
MSEMVLKVEAAVAEAVLGAGASPKFLAKLGVFLADHPGLIGRAAIEAMRTPTVAMIDSVSDPGFEEDNGLSDSEARYIWSTMIDEALK